MTSTALNFQQPHLLRGLINEGGSGRGMSFWASASRCGKRALLQEAQQEEWTSDPTRLPIVDPTKKIAFVVGSVYHKLHELWRLGKLDDLQLDFNEVIDDVSVALGVHLFQSWRRLWSRDLWGYTEEVETKFSVCLPSGLSLGAKPDLVTTVSADQKNLIEASRGLQLPKPGRYLVDFKTEAVSYDQEYYAESLQSYWYPYAYNIRARAAGLPEVEGLIHDVVKKPNPRAKDQTLNLDNYSAYFTPAYDSVVVEQTLEGLISQGQANIERAEAENLGNRSECFKIEFGQVTKCPFYQKQCAGR